MWVSSCKIEKTTQKQWYLKQTLKEGQTAIPQGRGAFQVGGSSLSWSANKATTGQNISRENGNNPKLCNCQELQKEPIHLLQNNPRGRWDPDCPLPLVEATNLFMEFPQRHKGKISKSCSFNSKPNLLSVSLSSPISLSAESTLVSPPLLWPNLMTLPKSCKSVS